MSADLTCKQLIEFLDDYVAERQPAETRAAFEAHLRECPPCVAYLRQYRASLNAARSALTAPAAPAAPEELIRAIMSARGQTPPGAPPR